MEKWGEMRATKEERQRQRQNTHTHTNRQKHKHKHTLAKDRNMKSIINHPFSAILSFFSFWFSANEKVGWIERWRRWTSGRQGRGKRYDISPVLCLSFARCAHLAFKIDRDVLFASTRVGYCNSAIGCLLTYLLTNGPVTTLKKEADIELLLLSWPWTCKPRFARDSFPWACYNGKQSGDEFHLPPSRFYISQMKNKGRGEGRLSQTCLDAVGLFLFSLFLFFSACWESFLSPSIPNKNNTSRIHTHPNKGRDVHPKLVFYLDTQSTIRLEDNKQSTSTVRMQSRLSLHSLSLSHTHTESKCMGARHLFTLIHLFTR